MNWRGREREGEDVIPKADEEAAATAAEEEKEEGERKLLAGVK